MTDRLLITAMTLYFRLIPCEIKAGRRIPKMGKFRFKAVHFTRVCEVQSAGKGNDDQRCNELHEVRCIGGTKSICMIYQNNMR